MTTTTAAPAQNIRLGDTITASGLDEDGDPWTVTGIVVEIGRDDYLLDTGKSWLTTVARTSEIKVALV